MTIIIIVNILLIVGLAAFISPIKVKNDVVKKELPILLVVTSMFTIAILSHYIGGIPEDFILNRIDGLLFIIFFLVFIFYIVSSVKAKQGFLEYSKPKYNMLVSILLVIVCCIGIVFASDIVVDNARNIASLLNVSTKIITMTVVVIGTSLPEMTMTVIAAKKGEFDIALGNIIGTNIFNICIVLGLPIAIYGGVSSSSFNVVDTSVVLLSALMFYIFGRSNKELSRREGLLMVLVFILYYTYVFIS